jgi:carbon-monoxide dehydrogenase medium subunit
VSFELLEPATLEEALAVLGPGDVDARAIAGGTALSLLLQSRIFAPARLVSLRRIAGGLRGIHVDDEGGLRIGAMTTLTEMERSPLIAIAAPVIARALRGLSNVRIRNVATIGGHLAHADPHMDLPPILLTLGARVRVDSRNGIRWIDLADLIVGYYETALQPGELIVEVLIPAQPPGARAAYAKFTALSVDDWPSVGIAAWFRRENDAIDEVRIAIGGATERVARSANAEAALLGTLGTAAQFAAAADAAADDVRPLADMRGSAAYKREMVRVHVRRALEAANASPAEHR